MYQLQNPLHIIGIELRTTNDNGRSFYDIPPFWDRFLKEGHVSKIPNKNSDNIYAIYTNFENEGKNNQGMYSLIIGCSVFPTTEKPTKGYIKIEIPAGSYLEFPVEKGRPDKIAEVWQNIWAIPDNEKHDWRFKCEFECYQPTGEINIFIGIKY